MAEGFLGVLQSLQVTGCTLKPTMAIFFHTSAILLISFLIHPYTRCCLTVLLERCHGRPILITRDAGIYVLRLIISQMVVILSDSFRPQRLRSDRGSEFFVPILNFIVNSGISSLCNLQTCFCVQDFLY
jgi:hypothetical protein